MKPMLACDAPDDLAEVRFPVIAQPKIDGVRGLNLYGGLTGRSLKPFKNKYVTSMFSHSALLGFDGELAAERSNHPSLCRMTTSATNTIEGAPVLLWHLFDLVTADTIDYPYSSRLGKLGERLRYVRETLNILPNNLLLIPSVYCSSLPHLVELEQSFLRQGYEGMILRDPDGMYKSGRATEREGSLLRVKRFTDAEGVVFAVNEGETNLNEAQTNELGHTERSTHAVNMIPNGRVGTLDCSLLQDVVIDGKTVLREGEQVRVSAGKLTAAEREHYFLLPNAIIGKVVKFQFFGKGMKDKLRFATFQSIRQEADL